jgi:hypothetical protein
MKILITIPLLVIFSLKICELSAAIVDEQFDSFPNYFNIYNENEGGTNTVLSTNVSDGILSFLTDGLSQDIEIELSYPVSSADTSTGVLYFTVEAGNSALVTDGGTLIDEDGDIEAINQAVAWLAFSSFSGDDEVALQNHNGRKRITFGDDSYIEVSEFDKVYLRLSYDFNTSITKQYYSTDGSNFIELHSSFASNDNFSITLGAESNYATFNQGDVYFDNFVISDDINYGSNPLSDDTDGDGKSNSIDIDDDNDGIADSYDPFPLVYDVSENGPSSLSGYVEIFFSDYYPSYGVWYGSGENSAINIFYDGGNEFRFEDSYTWDNESLTSTGYYGGGTFRTNFKTKTNDLFFKFTYVSESSELYADDSGKGFFYDGRIDLDSNGMADGEQITNGLPFPAANSIIDLANVYSSAESNLIPIQVLDYASNEKYFPSELKDLRPGSTTIQISENQATVQLQMEESSDLQTWEDKGDPATMTIPADTDTKFFRFKMAD